MPFVTKSGQYLTKVKSNIDSYSNPFLQLYEKHLGTDGAGYKTFGVTTGRYTPGTNTLMVFVNGQKAESVASPTNSTQYQETSSSIVTFGAALQPTDTIEFMVVGQTSFNNELYYRLKDDRFSKNFIINGAFDIWQVGTSFSALNAATFICDMWKYTQVNDGSMNISQESTIVPTVANGSTFKSNYSLKINPNVADTSIAHDQYAHFYTRIEGYNYRRLKDRIATLSFWVRSNKPGIYCVNFGNNGNDRRYTIEYTINNIDTWEKKIVSLTFNQTGGTESYTNDVGLSIIFVLACGTDRQVAANSWIATGLATSNQVNFMDNVSNTFYIALVQLELGSVATDFEYRSIDQELAMCQRYYEKSYDLANAPGSAPINGEVVFVKGASGILYYIPQQFTVRKRIDPAFTVYAASSGTIHKIRNLTSNTDIAATESAGGYGESGSYFSATVTAGSVYAYHWVADARL